VIPGNGRTLRKSETLVRTFEDLDVWKVCRELREQLSTLSRSFPKEERHRLTDQIIRASRSVTANLAEGYGRFHYAENIQFVRQARGSLYEVLDHLTVARDEKYVSEEIFKTMQENVLRAVSVVNGFIRYLVKAKTSPSINV
jgi:four helix bundle protein